MASGLLGAIGSALQMRSDDCAARRRASGMAAACGTSAMDWSNHWPKRRWKR